MTTILLTTEISAGIGACFDIARSVDAHLSSMTDSNERVVAGRAQGLCQAGDTITWQAKHFGIYQRLTVEITRMEYPHFFEDRMVRGAFRSMRHEHHFEAVGNTTIMKDVFMYEVPFGVAGRIFGRLVLHKYLKKLLEKRNRTIKIMAERER